jgi:hypothetical protein
MAMPRKPAARPAPKPHPSFVKGGRGERLWSEVTTAHPTLDATRLVILEEACRCADRLDELDSIIQGRGVLHLMRFRMRDLFSDEEERNVSVEVRFDSALGEARQQQNVFKQLLVSLRLPDTEGQQPQRRGARGAYQTGGSPSSSDAAPPAGGLKRFGVFDGGRSDAS